jgi:hypothetical protein
MCAFAQTLINSIWLTITNINSFCIIGSAMLNVRLQSNSFALLWQFDKC